MRGQSQQGAVTGEAAAPTAYATPVCKQGVQHLQEGCDGVARGTRCGCEAGEGCQVAAAGVRLRRQAGEHRQHLQAQVIQQRLRVRWIAMFESRCWCCGRSAFHPRAARTLPRSPAAAKLSSTQASRASASPAISPACARKRADESSGHQVARRLNTRGVATAHAPWDASATASASAWRTSASWSALAASQPVMAAASADRGGGAMVGRRSTRAGVRRAVLCVV
jgi:hypothetical protein